MYVSSSAFTASSHYQASRRGLESAMLRMSSGDRFASIGGDELASTLSSSERFRSRIHTARASTQSLQRAASFVQNAESTIESVSQILHRMTELAALSTGSFIDVNERKPLESEYQQLKDEISSLTRRETYFSKQTVGRDVIVSYKETDERISFWQPDGGDGSEITRNFGSTDVDEYGTLIGFDSAEDFTMGRDGRSFYYMGVDSVGAYRLKMYDIETNAVAQSSITYNSGDTIFVDEAGQLFANRNGQLYCSSNGSLELTTVAGVANMVVGSQFSVYDDEVTYRTTANAIERYDRGSVTRTPLVTGFAPAGEYIFSASGRFVAEKLSNTQACVTFLGTSAADSGATDTYTITSGTLDHLQFNEDGDRLYYVNDTDRSIDYLNTGVDSGYNVLLSAGNRAVQGTYTEQFDGLDLGGVNPGSIVDFLVVHDTPQTYTYESADLRLYSLGIANSRIDGSSATNSSAALEDLKTAINRLNAERARLGAKDLIFEHARNANLQYISDIQSIESQIRDVNVAEESTKVAMFQVKNSGATAILAHFNTLAKNILLLLQQ